MSYIKKLLILGLIAGILIPGYYLITALIAYRDVQLPAFNALVKNMALNVIYTLVVTAIITTVNLLLIKKFFEKKYPWHGNKGKRIILELLITNIVSASLITLFVIILYNLYPLEMKKQMVLSIAIYQNITIAFVINNIVTPLYEARFLFREWIKTRIEAEQLKREKAESQYAALRNQINPHFLFNSLNTLLTMVSDNPEAAQYVESLSDFLRYVLQTHDREAVTLKEELNMANQYIFIQRTRFGDKLVVNTAIAREYLDYAIPPFALQMLLENAIKHNIVSREYPLHINIYAADQYLTVENKIRRKLEENQSTGIGLANITNRFKYLSDRQVIINSENGQFKVSIPLVKMSL